MSGLIKASAAGAAVQPLGLSRPVHHTFTPVDDDSGSMLDLRNVEPSDKGADRAEALDRQCLELEAAIAQLRSQLADAEREAEQREDAAFAKGHAEGLALVSVDEDKRIAALAAGLDRLMESGPLAQSELLALQLSRAALARLFGDESLHTQLIEDTIASQLARLGRDLVLGISVSPLDFGSEEALTRLADRFKGVALVQDDALPPGSCVARLRLGRIDLSLPTQWRNLSDYFDQLTSEDADA